MTSEAPCSFWSWLDRCFLAPVPAARLGALRALVCGVALYDVWLYAGLVFADAKAVSTTGAERPWTPLFFMQVLGLDPVGLEVANLVFVVGTVALLLGLVGVLSRWSCAVGALAFFYWSGLAYSFGKPHHDKVALAFALMALPFANVGARVSVDAVLTAWWQRRRGYHVFPIAPVSGLPIWITQFTLAVGYCGAGSAKLLLGGVDWFNGYTLQGIMLGHDGAWSRAFASSVFWCQVQSLGVVFVQTAFPLVLLWPRSRWFFLPAAMGFHLMTWMTMDTGPYMRVWLLLFAFTPMEQIPATLHAGCRRGPLPAILTVVGVGAFVALVVGVANQVLPLWALLAGLLWLFGAWVRARPG